MAVSLGRHPVTPGIFLLRAEIWLPRRREDVFDFFADAFNLEAITPPLLHFHVETPPPIAMHVGALIDYRLRLHGFPIRWRTEITGWEPPLQFVDEQVQGPYRLWRHRHSFVERNGGTLMTDEVEYAVPGGTLVHALAVKGDVARIFEFREQKMRELFFAAGETAETLQPAESRQTRRARLTSA
ncbi:SRPBCC family protein [Planctellipticum variicoloris]|uniref:SRPBCC family protein n=1 Tax=Planctellipticum variicoloris TaxID=3064265 RepID=UPI0030140ABD|nr:SRPBCC family protein [Planctomycetaceae bacterium SH412]